MTIVELAKEMKYSIATIYNFRNRLGWNSSFTQDEFRLEVFKLLVSGGYPAVVNKCMELNEELRTVLENNAKLSDRLKQHETLREACVVKKLSFSQLMEIVNNLEDH